MFVMAGKKQRNSDRHKPARMVRIRERIAAQVDQLAIRLESDFTEIVNTAVREKLEREGLWPPPSSGTPSDE